VCGGQRKPVGDLTAESDVSLGSRPLTLTTRHTKVVWSSDESALVFPHRERREGAFEGTSHVQLAQ
jgi:hypothetical protein